MQNEAGSPKQERRPSRLKTMLRTAVQIWLLDRWIMDPIKDIAQRDAPLIAFGPQPKKKRPARKARTWWQRFWGDEPKRKKKAEEKDGSALSAVSAFVAGAAFIWLLGKTRRPPAGGPPGPRGLP
jgi:hypothetical protein